MLKRIFAMVLTIMLVLSSMTFINAAAGEYVPMDAENDVYQVPHAKSEITVDGVIGADEWKDAASTRDLQDMTVWMGDKTIGEGSRGYFMWDEDNLYFAFEFKNYTYRGTEYVTMTFRSDSGGDVTYTAKVADSGVFNKDGTKVTDLAVTHTDSSMVMEYTIPTSILTPEDIVWDAVVEDGYFFLQVWFGGTLEEGKTPMNFMSSAGAMKYDTFVLSGLVAGAEGFVPSVANTYGSWKLPKSQSVAFADGILETPEWANALEIDVLANSCFMNDTWAKPGAGSKYYMMYDDTNLYIALVYTYSDNFTADQAKDTVINFSVAKEERDINGLVSGDEGWNPGWAADNARYTIVVEKNDKVKYQNVNMAGASAARTIGEGALVMEVVIPRASLNLQTEGENQYYLGYFQNNDGGNLVMLPVDNQKDANSPYKWTTGNTSTFILTNKKAGTEGWEHVVDPVGPDEPAKEFETPSDTTGSVHGIRKAAVSPVVDGKITAKEWYNALVIDISGTNTEINWYMNGDAKRTFGEGSTVAMLWDAEYIYYAFDLKYNADWTHEGALGDESFEFRLSETSSGGEGNFYTMIVTPSAGTCTVNGTEVEGIKVAKETSESYKVEIALPISAFASFVKNGAVDNGYYYMQIRGQTPSFWVLANQCDQGPFGGAKNTYVLSPLAGGAVAPTVDEIPAAVTPIVADGKIGTNEWDNAMNLPITNEAPWSHIMNDTFSLGENAFIKAMYDANNLYLAFDLDNDAVEGKDDDRFQLFLCPTGDPSESNGFNACMIDFYANGTFVISNTGASAEDVQKVVDMITYVLAADDYARGEIVIPWEAFRTIDSYLRITKGFEINNQYVAGETLYWSWAVVDNSANGQWWGMYQPIGDGWNKSTAKHTLTTIPAGGVDAEEPAKTPELVITAPDSVNAGDEFTVDVAFANNPGTIDVKFNVEYDASKFEIVSIANGELFTTLVDSFDATQNGKFTGTVRVYSALSEADVTTDGKLVTITVRALANAEAGDGVITVKSVEAWSSPESTTATEGIELDVTGWVAGTATVAVTVPQHTHSMVKHDRVEATCTTNGNIEYYECEGCGKLFTDEAGENEITLEQTVLAALGHSMTKHDRVEATCTTNGNIEYYECGTCGKLFTDEAGEHEITLEETVLTATGHTMKKHDRVEATCTVNGNIEYYECEICGKLFTDEAGENEITLEQTVLAAEGHKNETKYDENGHWTECSVCHEKSETQAHVYGEWTVVKEAGIGTRGEKTHTCECGYTETAYVSEILLGDIDGDDKVDEIDAITLARYLVGWNITIENTAIADIDKDGKITDWDSIVLERWLAGWYA